ELRALDDRELRDERARVADQNAQRAEPGLGRLLEEVESRPGGRRDEGRRALAERRGNGALVAGIDLEERQGQALAPLGERTGGRWNPLALGERALERREALLRGQCTLGERVAVVRSLARGGTGIESLLLELLRRRPRTCGVGLGLRELGAQPGDQPRRRLTLDREARGAASQLEGDGQRGLALAGGARQLFLDRRAAGEQLVELPVGGVVERALGGEQPREHLARALEAGLALDRGGAGRLGGRGSGALALGDLDRRIAGVGLRVGELGANVRD